MNPPDMSIGGVWTSIVSRMSRRTCLGKMARALAYLSLCDLIPTSANWASMRRNQMPVPPHRRDKVSPEKLQPMQ
jgi:hypothetical protein